MLSVVSVVAVLMALVRPCSPLVPPSASAQRLAALAATVEDRPTALDPLAAENYVAMGLAKVFLMNEGKPKEQYIVEPLTAGTLETLQLGVPTSYCRVLATTCGDLFDDAAMPTTLNVEALDKLTEGYDFQLCESILERSMAAARTFRRRPEAASFVPVHETTEDVNFNTDRKRIMDLHYEPKFDDNVKQDRSIDVYGRSDDNNDALADEIKRLAES